MRIGELAAQGGVSTATIRFYERSGVLTAPQRNDSGYRDYPLRALDELRFVRAGQAIGLTLVELAEITAFREHGQAPCVELLALMERRLADVEQRLGELAQLRHDARDLHECPPAVIYGLLAPATSYRHIRTDKATAATSAS